MNKKFVFLILIPITVLTIGLFWMLAQKDNVKIENYSSIPNPPKIKPDYTDTIIPPNIAPLNFVINEPGSAYAVTIRSANGEPIVISGRKNKIIIPARKWKALLNANRAQKLYFDIYVKDQNNQWNRYESIVNKIADEEIDPYIVYRLMKPIYNWWHSIGIVQRNLTNYRESTVLKGESFNNGCLNCHTFLNNTTQKMTLGIRSSKYGSSVILADDEKAEKIDTKFGYTAWHPTGKMVLYSINRVIQFFHTHRAEVRDVMDLDSALAYYIVDSKKVTTNAAFTDKERLETYPTWSPDGRYLYFCSAPILWEKQEQGSIKLPKRYKEVKYDLMRISYNIETDTWGDLETVLAADQTGLSIVLPRISPDGRFLLFCMCDYGCFPIYEKSSDLYMMDLQTGKYSRLDVNTQWSESWHSFSSNSRWIAFSSKKYGGLFTRSFISYVDKTGKVHKQFVMPQKDPTFYDSCLKTYSVPELIKEPVRVSQRQLAHAVRSNEKIEVGFPLTGATMIATEPWQQGQVRE